MRSQGDLECEDRPSPSLYRPGATPVNHPLVTGTLHLKEPTPGEIHLLAMNNNNLLDPMMIGDIMHYCMDLTKTSKY